eukprot:1022590-Rhodomonas_salina.1
MGCRHQTFKVQVQVALAARRLRAAARSRSLSGPSASSIRSVARGGVSLTPPLVPLATVPALPSRVGMRLGRFLVE